MPSRWGKYSSKDVKRKASRGSFIEAIHRKFIGGSESKNSSRSGGSESLTNNMVSEKGLTLSRSALTSVQVSGCQSFAEDSHAQPLPPPGLHLTREGHANSGNSLSRLELQGCFKPVSFSTLSRHEYDVDNPLASDTRGDLGTASVSSNSSMDTDDQPHSWLLIPQVSDYESGYMTAMNDLSRKRNKDQSPFVTRRFMEQWNPRDLPSNNQFPFTSTKHRGSMSVHVSKSHIPPRTGFFSAPGSSVSSPKNAVIACGDEKVMSSGVCAGAHCSDMNLVGSRHCSSPGSFQTSAHNSVGRDPSLFLPQSRCSPECSPIPSPKGTSPCQSAWLHVGDMTTIHPRVGGLANELSLGWPEDGKPQSHRLPLPPVTVSTSSPFPPSYSSVTLDSLTFPRNPGRTKCSLASVSCWKKGRLIGSGTFGHVYVGFNNESGEMCAMKEVTLFLDDAKSKESMRQLEQEIILLSHISHPNIVRYLGSEMVEDKLYVYLEYVSGGSIHKVLSEYGKLGESAIRSYTQKILCGLAYLHAKNTVHRDIKGANLLVDPSGRVKLADFGMAKHITGQSCRLSFKGSPYWMAPEVISNPNECNLAVDIWSLGCTVIEMATGKPPWSQYEGVAAIFKIGNSKELPAIPYHLSEEGKDFIRQCLKRNPLDRPTAIQLLAHPFVRNVSALPERSLDSPKSPDAFRTVSNAASYKDMGPEKMSSCFDLDVADVQLSGGCKIGSGFSDLCIPKHLSCPISPIGSPLLRPKSSQPTCRRWSPAISNRRSASGPSTPHTGGNGAFPMHHSNHSRTCSYEGAGVQCPQRCLYASGSSLCSQAKPQALHGLPEISDGKFTRQSVCKACSLGPERVH